MGLETGTYISDLNASNPTASDSPSEADDHMRLIKSTVKATFPNINGAVNTTQAELNVLDGIDTSEPTVLPPQSASGSLYMLWDGSDVNIPAGWVKADGSNGTTDLTSNGIGGLTWIAFVG